VAEEGVEESINQGEASKMKVLSKISLALAALAFIGMTSGSAYADGIVLVSPDIQKLVPPLAALNLQHHGKSTTESGGVRYTGSGDQAFGDISAGPHQHTVSFTELGLARASDLRVLININEANGGNKAPITIDSLVLTAYDQNGNSVFTASLLGPVTLNQFRHGQGANSDFALGLDAEAAARLQAALDQNPALRLGLSASLSNVDGGPERFLYGGANTTGPVPEPATIVLFGTSLAGLAGAVRRRRKAAAAILASQQENT
jgi:PEP-CTERM motif-containing protein